MSHPIFYTTANPLLTIAAIFAGALILASLIYLICGTRKVKLGLRHKGVAFGIMVLGVVVLPLIGFAQLHLIHSQFHTWVNQNYNVNLTQQQATDLFDYSADGITVKIDGKLTRLVYIPYKDGHTVKKTTLN